MCRKCIDAGHEVRTLVKLSCGTNETDNSGHIVAWGVGRCRPMVSGDSRWLQLKNIDSARDSPSG